MKPILSIGLPFFNNEKTLTYAIFSVLDQTFQDWELILIDDGSFDNSKQIAKEFQEIDSRIILISDGENKGLIHRLNQIIDLANGRFIARMDADDIMMPEKLDKQMNVLINNDSIDVIDTAIFTIDENNKPIGKRSANKLNNINLKTALKGSFLVHPTIVVKKDWYLNNKYCYGYERGEDYELWCRTINNTKFYRIKEPLFIYREGKVNITNYEKSMVTVRKVLSHYGPQVFTRFELRTQIISTYIKQTIYYIFAFFNIHNYLSKKRNLKLNDEEFFLVKNRIKKINEMIFKNKFLYKNCI